MGWIPSPPPPSSSRRPYLSKRLFDNIIAYSGYNEDDEVIWAFYHACQEVYSNPIKKDGICTYCDKMTVPYDKLVTIVELKEFT